MIGVTGLTQCMLQLVRAYVPHHAQPLAVLPQDREAAVRVPRVDQQLEFIPEALDGVLIVNTDNFDVPISLDSIL